MLLDKLLKGLTMDFSTEAACMGIRRSCNMSDWRNGWQDWGDKDDPWEEYSKYSKYSEYSKYEQYEEWSAWTHYASDDI